MKRVPAALALAIALPLVAETVPERAPAGPIKTELTLGGSLFAAGAPLIVDVWVENRTENVIWRNEFSPLSSSVGLPHFRIRRVPNGPECSIPPGLFGDYWSSWYQPGAAKDVNSAGRFFLPARGRVHLLHGDLRLTILRARQHCQRALDEDKTMDRPDNASTKASYQDIVRCADDFLQGGTFDISVSAYADSPPVRITVEPPKPPTALH